MSVALDVAGDSLSRTTNLPTITRFTMMGWFNLAVDRNAITTLLCHGAATGTVTYLLCTDATGTATNFRINNVASAVGQSLAVNTWSHVAAVIFSAAQFSVVTVFNGVQDIVTDGDASITAGKFWIGNNASSQFLNGRAAAVKVYSEALSQEEIQLEMQQYLPVRTDNLNAFYPLLTISDQTVDYSGAGNALTLAGTLTTFDGPPIPWSMNRHRVFSRAAAAVFPPRPVVVSQAVAASLL